MRRLLLVGIAFAAMASADVMTLPVINPGFEGNLDGWSYTPNLANTSAQDGVVDFTEAHTGQSSLKLVMDSGGSGVWQDVSSPLPAGAVVELSWWMYMPNAGSQSNKWLLASLGVNGNFSPTSGCGPWLGAQDWSSTCKDGALLSQATPLSSWTQETLSFTLPSAVSSIAFQFTTQNGNGSGPAEPLWVDDVTLQVTAVPEPRAEFLLGTCILIMSGGLWRRLRGARR
jgi:hypothetical protein